MARDTSLRPPPHPPNSLPHLNLTPPLDLAHFPLLPSSPPPTTLSSRSLAAKKSTSLPWAAAPVDSPLTIVGPPNSVGHTGSVPLVKSAFGAIPTVHSGTIPTFRSTTVPAAGLIPSMEEPSITSNAVIAGLNAHLPPVDTPTPKVLFSNLNTNRPAQANVKTWASKFQVSIDRSLKRLLPISYSPEGVPRVLIPDEVFHRGVELHKDFVVGIFMGITPSLGHIQKVLSHIWGRGNKLEIT